MREKKSPFIKFYIQVSGFPASFTLLPRVVFSGEPPERDWAGFVFRSINESWSWKFKSISVWMMVLNFEGMREHTSSHANANAVNLTRLSLSLLRECVNEHVYSRPWCFALKCDLWAASLFNDWLFTAIMRLFLLESDIFRWI